MNRSFMFLMHRPRPIGLIDAADISGNEEAQARLQCYAVDPAYISGTSVCGVANVPLMAVQKQYTPFITIYPTKSLNVHHVGHPRYPIRQDRANQSYLDRRE